jgi:histidinol-phosphate aminotransferase
MTDATSTHTLALRSAYRDIPLYGGGDPVAVAIDLSDNTNQWGVPPAAARALAQLSPDVAARYPHAYSPGLARAIAEYVDVSPDMVMTGCGSDHVLDCAFRALAEPGSRVAYLDPSFVIVPSFARANSLEPVSVPWILAGRPDEPELAVNADAVLATGARLIYLCSPNNPTGTVIPPALIERIVAGARGLVIVDEAYAEFGEWSAVSLLGSASNLIVTRTFSKAFGMAGLRIGYALGTPMLVRECAKARGPFALTGAAEPAAVAALRHDLPWVREHVALAIESRERLAAALRAAGGYRVYASGANFLLVAPDESRLPDAMTIARDLRTAGIAVRAFRNLPGIGGALRITVAPWDVMEQCLAALPRADSSP